VGPYSNSCTIYERTLVNLTMYLKCQTCLAIAALV